MTDTFREISRNMQANEQHLRTNPADRSGVDDAPADRRVGRAGQLQRCRRHDRLSRRPEAARLAACSTSSSSLSTTRRTTDRSNASAGASRRRRSSPATATAGSPADATVGRGRRRGEYIAFINNDARPDAAVARGGGGRDERGARRRLRREQGARLGGRDGRLRRRRAVVLRPRLQAARRRAGRRPLRTRPHDVLFAHRRGDGRAGRRLPIGRRLRRALLHVLRGRRLRLAVVAARLAGALRARVGGVPSPPRVDGEVQELARAVPARAQRALHDLQELRRRRTSPGSCRRPWRWRCAVVSRCGGVDAHALDLERGVAGEADDSIAMPKSTAASMFAVDAFVENMRSLRETRTTSAPSSTR